MWEKFARKLIERKSVAVFRDDEMLTVSRFADTQKLFILTYDREEVVKVGEKEVKKNPR